MITTELHRRLLQDCLMHFLQGDDKSMPKQNRALLFVDTWNRVRPQKIALRYTFKNIVVTVTKAVSGKYSTAFQIRNMTCISNEFFDSLDEAECYAEMTILSCI